MAKKVRGHASTIDRFGLAFQYQILKQKRMDENNRNIKMVYNINAYRLTSAIWQHMLHIPPTALQELSMNCSIVLL